MTTETCNRYTETREQTVYTQLQEMLGDWSRHHNEHRTELSRNPLGPIADEEVRLWNGFIAACAEHGHDPADVSIP